MITRILESDERQAQHRVALYAPLAARDPELRAELREADRRLAIVGEIRVLYADLRAAKQRVASDLVTSHGTALSQ